jgi:hypothetical protein
VDDIPEWFQSTLRAISANEWYVTTGVILVSHSRSGAALVADIGKESRHHHVLRREDGILFGHTALMETKLIPFHLRRAPPKNKSARRHNEGLIVIGNRFRYSETIGREVPRDDEAIVSTFFHELGAHAGLISEGASQESDHTSPNWQRGDEPMSKADILANQVSKFFKPNEADEISHAMVSGLSVGVITNLDEEGLTKEQIEDLEFLIHIHERTD